MALLGNHRLGLDHLLYIGLPRNLEHDAVDIVGLLGPMHLPAIGGDVGLQILQQVGQMADHMLLHLAHLVAQLSRRRRPWRLRWPVIRPVARSSAIFRCRLPSAVCHTFLIGKMEIDG